MIVKVNYSKTKRKKSFVFRGEKGSFESLTSNTAYLVIVYIMVC